MLISVAIVMNPTAIFYLFLVFWVLQLVVDLLLTYLNIRSIKQHAGMVPEFFREWIDFEAYKKSQDYSLAKAKFAMASSVLSSVTLLFVVSAALLGRFDQFVSGLVSKGISQSVCFMLLFLVLTSVISMPLSIYSTFVIEERFGFNRMTFGLWIRDKLKGLVLSLILSAPLFYGLFWFMESSGPAWWLYAFLFVAAFQLLLVYVFPVVIAPLFNKFTPLADGGLKDRIEKLAERLQFFSDGIFLMDGSKRSGHGNAYFTGLGRKKRIVLFDTLISELAEAETEAVLAHEIGHSKCGHIKKGVAVSFLFLLVGFFALGQVYQYQPLFLAFGLQQVSLHGALVVFSWGLSPLLYFLHPLTALMSRAHEYEADRFAVDALSGASGLISALCKLSRKSLSNLTPHALYSAFHYSHPTLAERIAAMRRYEAQRV